MKQSVLPVALASETNGAAMKARGESYGVFPAAFLATLLGAVIAFVTFAFLDSHNPANHIWSAVLFIGVPSLVEIGSLCWLYESHKWSRVIKHIARGDRVDPRLADPLTVTAISVSMAVNRYNEMVVRWEIYEEDCTESGRERHPDEDAIRDAIVAAGADLRAYAERTERRLQRRKRLSDLSAMSEDMIPYPSLPDAIDNLRGYDEKLREITQRNEDPTAADSEKLLAEPLNLAKLAALDKELARIRVPTRVTNG